MPTTTPFNNLITFSRGSNATVTGPNGLIQWAPNNLLTFSEQFDNAGWTKLNATVTANTAVAPDGTTTADTLTTSGIAAAQRVGQNPTNTGVSTFSIYVKAGTAQFVQLIHSSDANAFANFDVGSGTLGTRGTGSSSTITDVGNGWYRCTLTFNIASSTFWYAYIVPSASAAYGASFTATVANVLIWGAQLEIGSTATTYNPTTVKNLLGFSEAFDNAAWTKTSARIITGAAANPINGLFNAQKLMEDTANALHFTFQSTVVIANTRYVQSVYAKAAERNWIWMTEGNNVTAQAYFDLANGVVGTVAGTGSPSATITPVGNGWYRCSLAFTPIAAFANTQVRLATANGGAAYTGDGNSGVYIYGAQLSDSASLDPYVPTPGAAPSSTAFYGPRFDFDPVTLLPRGLLVEEQRTNLLLRSDDFTTPWAASGATITANATASPDGTVNADALVEDGTTGLHLTQQFFTFLNATAYTVSIFIKPSTRTWVQVLLPAAAFTASQGGFFNLSGAGSLGTVTGTPTSRSITAVGNGWYRITITATSTAAAGGNIAVVAASADGTTSYAGTNGATALFPWGAQLEAGAFATSYIPTVASTVTRSADVATITGQNFAQWYGQDEGTIVGDISLNNAPAAATFSLYAVSDNTANERIFVGTGVGSGGNINTLVTDGGVLQAQTVNGGLSTAGIYRYANAYKLNDFASVANGGAAVTDTSGTVPTVDRLYAGASALGTAQINGHIRSIRFIPARAADFQLQGLST